MLRWLGILVAIALCSTSVDAQVFKPRAKKPVAAEKKKAKKSAKKQPRGAAAKKRVAKQKKAKRRRDRVAASESRDADKDYVKIWDDDEIE